MTRQQRNPATIHAGTDHQILEALLGNVNDAIVMVDLKQRIRFCNRAVEQLYQAHAEELIGQPLSSLYTVYWRTATDQAAAQQALDEIGVWHGVQRHHTKDGRNLTLEVVFQRLPRNNRYGADYLLFLRDIPERQIERQNFLTEASKLLADSLEYEVGLSELVRLLVPRCADWCVINMLNDQQTIEPVAWAHVDSGKAPLIEELCQRYPLDPQATTGSPHVIRNGLAEWYPLITQEMLAHMAKTEHERTLWSEIGCSSLMIVPLLRHGRAIGALTLAIADTNRRYTREDLALAEDLAHRAAIAIENARLYKAEREARAEAEHAAARSAFLVEAGVLLSRSLDYEQTLQQLADLTVPGLADLCVIFLVAPDGTIHRTAAAHSDPQKELQLLELQKQGAIDPHGPHPAAIVIREGQPAHNPDVTLALAHTALPEEQRAQIVEQLVPRDQLIIPLIARKHVIGAVALGIDQSNRAYTAADIAAAKVLADRAAMAIDHARLYRDVQEAVRVRDSFLLIASHELKTPLTAMLGQAQLLQRRLAATELATRDQRAIRVIVEQTHRLNKLVGSLLDVSRLSQGQLAITCTPFDLNPLVQRTVHDFQLSTEQHTVVCELPEQPLVINGDELRLEQVFQNLLQNAIKYSPHESQVLVRVERLNNQAVVMVSDQGIGIPEGAIANLFQRFYRVNSAASQPMSGIGIGLYVVREIITLHGGSVFVESTEGQGSTFTIALPLFQAPTAITTAAAV